MPLRVAFDLDGTIADMEAALQRGLHVGNGAIKIEGDSQGHCFNTLTFFHFVPGRRLPLSQIKVFKVGTQFGTLARRLCLPAHGDSSAWRAPWQLSFW